MSSGIEIVASIITVASAGFRLSLILNAVSCEIANAPAEIHAISKSLTFFSLLLKQTAAVLDQAEPVHSQEVIRVAEQVLEESNAVFHDINTILDRVRTRKQDGTLSPSRPQRFKWCFKRHGIEYLLGRMDRLQMSLSLMLQIIQLGTTMASTSRNDSPQRVKEMSDKIQRERVEAQNIVVLYSSENQRVDQLYVAAREEQTEPQSSIEYSKDSTDSDALTLVSSHDSQLANAEELPVYTDKDVVIQPPARVLSGFEENWQQMNRSPEDMLKSSEEVINRLLERWTIWREKRDQELRQPRSRQNSRYHPVVQESLDEDDFLYSERYQDRDDSPSGKYIEGVTTDWRQPQSGEARQKRAQLRKQYAAYQASVEGGSELEDSPTSTSSKKKSSRKHAIDSDEYTSESEEEKTEAKPHPRRRSSAIAIPSQLKPRVDDTPVSKSYGGTSKAPAKAPTANNGAARPSLSPTWSQYQQQHRPSLTPDQNRAHHSFSSPVPANYMHNGAYVYPPPGAGPQSPSPYHPPNAQTYPFPQGQHQRYVPPRPPTQASRQAPTQQRPVSKDGPQRPVSRDGRPPRSPSRLSREYTPAEYKEYEAAKKRQKKELRRNIGDGAAKGLLAGGGLAVFLEALDSLSL
ncbi:hypothetical protein OHC33_006465 [Knufia fluminis]|uniref:Fungal N-terminal domain-containing protein n=1 Tax=Knufia fluminis TaxID=191047 RepID=A0AAN8EJR1_9EURO|nr:hypothetical protein OHC33_006465 [Knufia fluminis]